MSGVALTAILITALLTVLFELWAPRVFGVKERGRRLPQPVLSVSLLAAMAGLAVLAPAGERQELVYALLGGLVLLVAALRTDYGVPSSKRHALGVVAAASIAWFGGLRFAHLNIPFMGVVALDAPASFMMTVAWVFLVVGIIEVCSLLPLLTSVAALAVGAMVVLPVEVRETLYGQALAGMLLGAVAGRFLGEVLRVRSRVPEKSETLLLAYIISLATLSMFLKSITTASFLLPLSFAVILIVVLVVQSFERSLILRPSPRD